MVIRTVGKRNQVYQFKVILQGIEPPIWRRIQVPASYSFWDLHVALQDSMGWDDYHLHMFRIREPRTGEVVEIGIPDDEPFEEAACLPGWEVPIAAYFREPRARGEYEYDFGDGWEHEVILEDIVARAPRQRYPKCLDGARACPPEDCGGIGGYEDLLRITRDPSHDEYESKMEWLGRRYDPDAFDPKKVRFDDPKKRWNVAIGNG
jgi:hypothetical protein